MKAIVFAYHNMGLTGLAALKRCGFDIRAVFSHEDDPGENCWFGSVVKWAEENRIPVFCPENANAPDWVEKISDLRPEVIFSFYYRHLIAGEILRIPPAGAYNLHGSLLPAYRGRCPVNWVLVKGEKTTGVTLHHMVERADAGDIVGQKAVEIGFADTALTLSGKLCMAAEALLMEMLPRIKNGTVPRVSQDLRGGSYFGGRSPEDGRIYWGWSALRIYNLIRALTNPYPGAFAVFPDGMKMIIWWGAPEQDNVGKGAPGTARIYGDTVVVKTGEGCLRLMDIELGGMRVSGSDIIGHFKNREGVILT